MVTLNLVLSRDAKHTSDLSISTSALLKLRSIDTVLLCVRKDMFDESIEATIYDEAHLCDRVNVMVTEDVDYRYLRMLNSLSDKIDTLVVVSCEAWVNNRKILNFCPHGLFILNKENVNVRKFASYK